jgi:hypothetical protein
MSDNQQGHTTPGGVYIPPGVPTKQDTQKAIDDIVNVADDEAAAAALQDLCTAVAKAVTDVDDSVGVSRWVEKLSVVCEGVGIFRLDVYTKNTDVDPEQVAEAAAQQLDNAGEGYCKPLRKIEMEFTDGKTKAV